MASLNQNLAEPLLPTGDIDDNGTGVNIRTNTEEAPTSTSATLMTLDTELDVENTAGALRRNDDDINISSSSSLSPITMPMPLWILYVFFYYPFLIIVVGPISFIAIWWQLQVSLSVSKWRYYLSKYDMGHVVMGEIMESNVLKGNISYGCSSCCTCYQLSSTLVKEEVSEDPTNQNQEAISREDENDNEHDGDNGNNNGDGLMTFHWAGKKYHPFHYEGLTFEKENVEMIESAYTISASITYQYENDQQLYQRSRHSVTMPRIYGSSLFNPDRHHEYHTGKSILLIMIPGHPESALPLDIVEALKKKFGCDDDNDDEENEKKKAWYSMSGHQLSLIGLLEPAMATSTSASTSILSPSSLFPSLCILPLVIGYWYCHSHILYYFLELVMGRGDPGHIFATLVWYLLVGTPWTMWIDMKLENAVLNGGEVVDRVRNGVGVDG